jgi:hypothetical protein
MAATERENHMQASPEVQRALATIRAVLEDLAPEAPLAVDQPSVSEVEEARRALNVLSNFFEADVEP